MAEFWLGDSNGPMGDVGAFMDSELRVDRADLAAHIRQLDGPRNLIAIAGAPGAGKSHLAAELAAALNAATPGSAAVLPMDGFHLSNDVLETRGLRARKGAPETFDVAALSATLSQARAPGADLRAPGFDRATDQVIPDAIRIPATARYVLVEGNYLLLTRPGWRDLFPLFDLTVRLNVPEPVLRVRLLQRWQACPPPGGDITAQIEQNDLPNGRILRQENRAADLVITG